MARWPAGMAPAEPVPSVFRRRWRIWLLMSGWVYSHDRETTPYLHQWVPASKLKKGEHLKTPDGAVAYANGGSVPADDVGWMWDLTVPGNGDHDFYVVSLANQNSDSAGSSAEAIPVLVHNNTCPTDPNITHGGLGQFATQWRLISEGYTNVVPEVQFRNSLGDAFRADFVGQNPQGGWEAFDAKLGPGSVVSDNQAIGYPELANPNIGAILNTDKLSDFGLEPGDLVNMPVTLDLWQCPLCNP